MGNELTFHGESHGCARGKGILAADESTGTIGRRLASINVANEEPNRRAWRQMLFTTEGYGKYISGVILYDETLRQSSDAEIPFVELLQNEGVIPGIKVDQSTNPLAGAPGELTTDGLDGLRDRLKRVLRTWRTLHQVASRHHHRRPHPI